MTKKSFIFIAILSFFAANIADILDGVINNTFIGGRSGFPFKDSLSLGFEGETSYTHMFILNILFWFVIIFIIWRVLKKVRMKKVRKK